MKLLISASIHAEYLGIKLDKRNGFFLWFIHMIEVMLKSLVEQRSTISNQCIRTSQPRSAIFLGIFGAYTRQRYTWVALMGAIMSLAVSHSEAQAASFSGLGFLSGSISSSAADVSANGSVVVGSSGDEAFRWTQASGLVGLGFVPGCNIYCSSAATGVSADGSVVVGTAMAPYPPPPSPPFGLMREIFRWTQAGDMESVSLLGYETFSYPVSVSANGSVIVSTADTGSHSTPPYTTAFILGKGVLAGTWPYLNSRAYGVSANGSVVVGSIDHIFNSDRLAALWTESGLQILGPSSSFASGVSADGTVVVGQSGNEAFIWNNVQGIQGVGFLPGNSSSYASDVSADGTVVVGQSGGEAFIWNNILGMQSLASVLTTAGVSNLTGWGLLTATAISADGYTVVGYGTNPSGQTEAWIADLRNPTEVPTPALLPSLVGMGLTAWHRRRRSLALSPMPSDARG
jgi:uncharacterized membrane protein